MNQEELQKLIARFIAGTATAAERDQLTDWYRHQADHEIIWETEDEEVRENLRAELLQGTLTLAGIRYHPAPVARHSWQWIRYAAAIIIVLCSIAYFWNHNHNDNKLATANDHHLQIVPGRERAMLTLADGSTIELDSADNGTLAQQGDAQVVKLANGRLAYHLKGLSNGNIFTNTMTTPNGGRYQLLLPDGTRVWLNAASSITYPAAFVGATRSIKVAGEVYLEVAKDKQKPFIVDINGQSNIEVLGTSFNINSYADEGSIKTTLLEGRVKVNNATILKPGQQAVTVNTGHHVITVDANDLAQVMAWKNGVFNFDHTDIQTVMRKIERWYDVEVVYEGAIPDIWFMGKIPMNTGIDRVLNILQKIGVHFRIEGKKIIVTK